MPVFNLTDESSRLLAAFYGEASMSERTTLTGDGDWHNIGTGPATVQLIAPSGTGAEVMIVCSATEPTGVDGMVLGANYSVHTFTLTDDIWAQVVQVGASATLAVQPEVAP